MRSAGSERQRIRQLIQGASVSMLLTLDDHGALSGRPMLPLLLDDDPHIYFLTRQSSQKVTQIADHPQIALTLINAGRYVVVVGRASVVRDPGLIRQLWRPTYRAWFADGKDDREASVLQVVVERVNYWEPPSSRIVRLVQAVKALLTHRITETPMRTIDGL
jgi:general stress protein 26